MRNICTSLFHPAIAGYLLLALLCTGSQPAMSAPVKGPLASPKQEFYAIRIYQLKTKEQESQVDKFLQGALVPALHRFGVRQVGVFKPIDNDTALLRRIYVLIPLHSLDQLTALSGALGKDAQYLTDGKDYLDAAYSDPPYVRMNTIILQAFPDMPRLEAPTALKTAPSEKIYELRSYEGPTEKYFINKVQMFNQGGEIPLFKRLGFNAVFYASVLSGDRMPNLMYMISFDNMASRDQHWKTFAADPFWKQLSADPQYQHNVSHIDSIFLHPTDYSDL